jgi:hypothetical protein
MTEKHRHRSGGRKPKTDPAVFRYSVSFNAEEHAEFLSRFEPIGNEGKGACIPLQIGKCYTGIGFNQSKDY